MLKIAVSCCPPPSSEATHSAGGEDFKRHSLITLECLTFSPLAVKEGLGEIFLLPLPGKGSLIFNVYTSVAAIRKYFHFLQFKRNMKITKRSVLSTQEAQPGPAGMLCKLPPDPSKQVSSS